MNSAVINIDLLKKIRTFLKSSKSLEQLDTQIFENIDNGKEVEDIDFKDYYLEYIGSLPSLDYETAIKISREVYQLYGKEKEFDEILNRLLNENSISSGSLNPEDNNCITNASESRILLSGTYYDVILICHEIGHKLRCADYKNNGQSEIMDSFFFETPSIALELSANDYLRDNYGVDIKADEMRKKHISTIKREDSIENDVFLEVMRLAQNKKLNAANLYIDFIRNGMIMDYLSRESSSIEECVAEGLEGYSYDIGYILGRYTNNSSNRTQLLNTILNYKDKGLEMPFTIDEGLIKDAIGNQNYTR